MDTEKCKVLLAVLEHGSLSDTAEALQYTPSGISRMMAAMEKELACPLLVRGRHGVAPTRECRALMPLMEELVRLDGMLKERSAELAGAVTGEIEIGTDYTAFFKPLADIVREFREEYPGVVVGIREGTSTELVRAVMERRVDFCIVSRREGEYDWFPFFEDPMIVWTAADHPAVKKGRYDLRDLEKDPYIQFHPGRETDASRAYESRGIRPNVRYTTSDYTAAYAMVEAGLGVTLNNGLFQEVWQGSVVSLPTEPPVRIPIGAAVVRESDISPAARRFRDFALPRLRIYMEKSRKNPPARD